MGSTHAAQSNRRSGVRRPAVLAALTVGSDPASLLIDAMQAASEGADGVDVAFSATAGPAERLAIADQLADASGLDICLRSAVPMSVGRHTLIVSADAPRPTRAASMLFDMGVEALHASPDGAEAVWNAASAREQYLVSTVEPGGVDDTRVISDAELMGLAVFAWSQDMAAVSTDRVRIVRRVIDTLSAIVRDEAA